MKHIIFSILIALTACAPVEPTVITRTEYQEVYIPQPCPLPAPVLAPQTGDVVVDMLSLEQYINELRVTVSACRGGEPMNGDYYGKPKL